jgi:hypothetical protein
VGVRSVIALLGGMILVFFLVEALEPPTVALLAPQRPADMDSYLAARNEPGVLPGRLAIYGVVGILAGYMVAKIAGQYEKTHAAAAFLLQAFMMMRGFAADPAAIALPFGTRALLVGVTGVGMMLGAAVRARAARLGSSTEVGS